jgi:hypothetical protein
MAEKNDPGRRDRTAEDWNASSPGDRARCSPNTAAAKMLEEIGFDGVDDRSVERKDQRP